MHPGDSRIVWRIVDSARVRKGSEKNPRGEAEDSYSLIPRRSSQKSSSRNPNCPCNLPVQEQKIASLLFKADQGSEPRKDNCDVWSNDGYANCAGRHRCRSANCNQFTLESVRASRNRSLFASSRFASMRVDLPEGGQGGCYAQQFILESRAFLSFRGRSYHLVGRCSRIGMSH